MTSTVGERAVLPRLALVGVFGGLFAGYLGLTAVIPVLPGFVRDRLGATDLVVGLVITATALSALVTRPIAGGLADRYGHRLVMRAGALAVGIGGALYFLPLGVAELIGVRLLLGIGEAALFTAGAVWTVSLAPQHRRGQLIGLYGVSMWGGISLGTLSGAVLLHFGYQAVWALSVAAPLTGAVLISAVRRSQDRPGEPGQPDGPDRPGEPGPRGQRERARRNGQVQGRPGLAAAARGFLPRPAVLPGTALALAAAGYAGLASFVVLMLKARGIHSGVVVLSTFSAVYAGTRLFIGHLPDKLGPRQVAAWSGTGEAAGLAIIAVAPNLPVAIAGSLIMGVGFSLLHPSLALMVMNRTDRSKQGTALGAYTSFWDLGIGVWGPLTGIIASGLGYSVVFVVGAACAGAAAVMALWIDRPALRPATVV
ncbi:MAG TPA: MFS transporter [Streptosporangiaceae bacterium]|nr:MFS transporter [Streptosporangiaceae bacterium]